MLKIGDFSKLSRVSIRMLRHYDEIGLLRPARIDRFTGYRYYTTGQLPRMNQIQSLRQMGFSLTEIIALLDGGAEIVGINARNLSTFETSLALAGELIRQIPAGKIAVAESEIRSADDLNAMEQLGAKAFLIGETLMRAERPGEKLCELLSK